MDQPVVQRYDNNPILTRDDVPYDVATVYNAGAVLFHGEYILLFRSNLRNGRSIIGKAVSRDGLSFQVESEPFLEPAPAGEFGEYEEYGVEDLRINPVEKTYYLTYSGYSRHGVRIMLARTDDFTSVERIGPITQADMRNVVLFPEKFGGQYVRMDRPHTHITPWSIWISSSPDLIHWGNSKIVITPMHYHWDEMKVGPGAPPIRTEEGWLNIFHGVYSTMSGVVYRLGAALHDLKDPGCVLGVADDWILQPEDPWEVSGYVPNVVFTCGVVPENDSLLRLYWGGADSVICTGTARITELISSCLHASRPPQ